MTASLPFHYLAAALLAVAAYIWMAGRLWPVPSPAGRPAMPSASCLGDLPQLTPGMRRGLLAAALVHLVAEPILNALLFGMANT